MSFLPSSKKSPCWRSWGSRGSCSTQESIRATIAILAASHLCSMDLQFLFFAPSVASCAFHWSFCHRVGSLSLSQHCYRCSFQHTFVPLPLQFPATSQITLLLLLLLLPIPGNFENYSWSCPWCIESLIWSRLTFQRYHCLDTIRRHCLVSNDGMRFCFPKCYVLFLCPGQMDPTDCVLSVCPLSLAVYLSWFRHVTLDCFFNRVGIQGCEEHSLSSFSDFFSPCNESLLQDWLRIEWASSVK